MYFTKIFLPKFSANYIVYCTALTGHTKDYILERLREVGSTLEVPNGAIWRKIRIKLQKGQVKVAQICSNMCLFD